MAKFSPRSLDNLKGVHPKLIALVSHVVERFDVTVLEGVRDAARQKILFDTGKSKTLDSKHLIQGDGYGHALDIAPYPVNWTNTRAFYVLGGYMLATAEAMDIQIRWGGDWNRNFNFNDQTFFDLPHFELVA